MKYLGSLSLSLIVVAFLPDKIFLFSLGAVILVWSILELNNFMKEKKK